MGVEDKADFLAGSHMSKGGKGFICLASTYNDKATGELRSCIVPCLSGGGIITDPRSQAFYVVTEYGKVNLVERVTWKIAERLISTAHTDFRDELVREAENMNVWGRSLG